MIKRIFYSYLTIKVNHQRPSILISGAILYFNDLRERRVTVENAFDNPVLSHADIIQKTRLLYQFYCINKLPIGGVKSLYVPPFFGSYRTLYTF